jgi:hypothetical protein
MLFRLFPPTFSFRSLVVAQCSGVPPEMRFAALTSAPPWISTRAQSTFPHKQAMCSALWPTRFWHDADTPSAEGTNKKTSSPPAGPRHTPGPRHKRPGHRNILVVEVDKRRETTTTKPKRRQHTKHTRHCKRQSTHRYRAEFGFRPVCFVAPGTAFSWACLLQTWRLRLRVRLWLCFPWHSKTVAMKSTGLKVSGKGYGLCFAVPGNAFFSIRQSLGFGFGFGSRLGVGRRFWLRGRSGGSFEEEEKLKYKRHSSFVQNSMQTLRYLFRHPI